MSTATASIIREEQPQPQLPTRPAHRQVSYEAAELVEDDTALVTQSESNRNGRRSIGSSGAGVSVVKGVNSNGGLYSVIGVALCAFVLGCLISFAATLLAMRVRGDASEATCPSAGAQKLWPNSRQLAANRARLRRLANSPAELENHVTVLTSWQSRAGTRDAWFHADYAAQQWRSRKLPVLNRTYWVMLSYLNTDAIPDSEIGVFLCRSRAGNQSASAADGISSCDEKLQLDRPLTLDDGLTGALRSIVPYSGALDGMYRLVTEEQLADMVAEFSTSSNKSLKEQLADVVVLVDAGLETGGGSSGSSASRTGANASVLGMAAGLLKKLAPEPRPGVPAYPKGTGVPDSLIWMKSTLATEIKGDPTTPMYPSKPYAIRSPIRPDPPAQPAVPISAADADRLRLFAAEGRQQLLRIRWPMRRGLRQISDVCTEVPGVVEPDRVVLLGGHRDAWHSGALDPHSGLSSLLVVTRALAELRQTGWQPRRTLLACTWDAEEWNLIGSAEWLDEELSRANRRLVGYVNTDTDIMGNWKVMVHAFRRWRGFLDELIAEVPNPDPEGDSHYHFYKSPDAYSDYYTFWRTLGVPIVDLSYIRPNQTRMVVYDLYHSRYDTVRLYRMTDPGGRAHLATVQNYLGIVYTLLDSPVLPANLTAFAEEIYQVMTRVVRRAKLSLWTRTNDLTGSDWSAMQAAFLSELRRASRALRRFESETLEPLRRRWLMLDDDGGPDGLEPLRLRMINDKLMEVQQAFVYRSVYPSQQLVNLLETNEAAFSNLFDGDTTKLMKLVETCILSLASVTKILSNSFAD